MSRSTRLRLVEWGLVEWGLGEWGLGECGLVEWGRMVARGSWIAWGALCLGLASGACGPDRTKPESAAPSARSSSPPAAAPATSARPDGSAESARIADDEGKAGVDALLDEKGDAASESPGFKVDLSQVKDDAPTIGDSAPTSAQAGEGEWIPAGSFLIPTLGMTKKVEGEYLLLSLGDGKGGVIFTPFSDETDAKAKLEKIKTELQLRDFRWKQKPTPWTLGPNKIPALVGAGHARGQDGKEAKLVYALIKGEPNLIAVVGTADDAPRADLERALSAIASLKRR
jgi:hypothetical protein